MSALLTSIRSQQYQYSDNQFSDESTYGKSYAIATTHYLISCQTTSGKEIILKNEDGTCQDTDAQKTESYRNKDKEPPPKTETYPHQYNAPILHVHPILLSLDCLKLVFVRKLAH